MTKRTKAQSIAYQEGYSAGIARGRELAAPDLLAALRALTNAIEGSSYMGAMPFGINRPEFKDAIAAIAKATGD